MDVRIGRVRISGGAVMALAALFFALNTETMLCVLTAVLIHELGHVLALWVQRRKIDYIRLEAFGLAIRCRSMGSYRQEIVATLAGPAFSFLLAFTAAAVSEGGWLLSGVSMTLGAFNLLPAYPLDGGRALYAFTASVFGPDAAEKISCAATCAVSLFILVCGLIVLIETGTNATLLISGAWLLFCYCKRSENSIKSIN